MVSQDWGDNSNEHWILKIQEGYHTHAEFLDEQRTGWNHLRGIQLPQCLNSYSSQPLTILCGQRRVKGNKDGRVSGRKKGRIITQASDGES